MKIGFTLSEVLITLSIIGVVSAITIPTFISNFYKRQTAIQLKQAYSLLSNAVAISISKNGPTNTWNYVSEDGGDWGNDAKNFFFTYFDEFLQVGQYCGIKHTEPRKGACEKIFVHGDTNSYSVILKNSVGLSLRADGSKSSMEIQIDVNGAKGPNRAGRDGFIFRINAQEGLVPVDNDLYGMKPCTRTLKNPNGYIHWAGWGCAYVIMNNNWEIPDYYPWNEL